MHFQTIKKRLLTTSRLNFFQVVCWKLTFSTFGILDLVKEGFVELDIDFREVVEAEHDMALGNGGLTVLAAAFMDSLATTGYPGFGNGLRYRYGLFQTTYCGWLPSGTTRWLVWFNRKCLGNT